MPRLDRSEAKRRVRLWKGRCPRRPCARTFRIEADRWQPKWDVLAALKGVRGKGIHVHGQFAVYEHPELGGE